MKTKKKKIEQNHEEENFLEIDEHSLEKEWVGQPALYHKYAKKLALARKRVDEAKAALELCEAEIDKAIRSNPKKFDLEKVTEPAVKQAIIADESYQTALENLHQAKYHEGVVNAGVVALDHRKKALENLVQLWSREYYSTPREPEGVREELQETTKKAIRRRTIN